MKKDSKRAYFVAVLAERDKYGHYYKKIAQVLRSKGYHVDDDVNKVTYKEALAYSDQKISKYFTKVEKLIRNCDIFIAESTAPSPSVGYEVGLAASQGKPVLILRHESVDHGLGAPFRANKNKIIVLHYNENNLEKQVNKFLKKAEKGIFVKRLPIEFTQEQADFVEELKKKYNQRSFNSTVRMIIDNAIAEDVT
jgi:nucleoside 2-deoxyribosyltransferase